MATNWICSLMLSAIIVTCVSESFIKYNEQTEICCNGAVSKKLPIQQRCCGAVAYNSEEQLCCSQTLHPVKATNDSLWACCYSTSSNASQEAIVYNARTHQCCGTKVLEKPEAGAMYECCEGHLYTTRTHRCCNKTVVKLEQGFDCCGNAEWYDTLTKKCCRASPTVIGSSIDVPYRLHDKDGRKCCGLELYGPADNYCCNQTVMPLPKSMMGQEDLSMECCGSEIKPKNLPHPLCYHDHWWGRNSTEYTVCAGQLINFKEEICCGNQTLARASGLSCCWGAEKPYDQKTQACCGSQIVPLSKEDLERGATSCCIAWRH